jgi:NADH-dependent peroxiredoxin subunit F
MLDLIIVGGGPAGLTAAVYALNKRLETVLLSEDLGGKTAYGFQLKGYEGHEVIRGGDLVENFKRQLEYVNFAHQADRVTKVVAENEHYAVLAQSGKRYEARAVIIATGALPKRLDVPGEKNLIGKGLSYSALSHAQLFIEREVALFGSSHRALSAAAELAWIAQRVHLILPDAGEIDSPLGKKLRANQKVTLYEKSELKEVRGNGFVDSVVIDGKSGKKEILVDGLFIELGVVPGSKPVADLGITDNNGRIKIDCACATSKPGVFAAGDVTDVFIEQVLIAVGEGAKAALSAYEYLLNQ